ncbi:MAG: hypothetical protein JMN24_04405 [gamma proteobacterium endosymbiont of Lamellibrachia anaximandri]|nr:hypothetical protein [gamma proteobacterium endosymbiont of Lamellibrachia anaximandri]MBL3617504.1 hypothetical protein [gamma proteobacterium endosymbiont of Lamellibrachia anaximandri]
MFHQALGERMNPVQIKDWLLRWALAALLVLLLQHTMPLSGSSFPSDAWLLVNLGLATSLTCLLMLPHTGGTFSLVFNSIASTGIFLLMLFPHDKGTIPNTILLQSTLAVFTITLLLITLAGFLKRFRATADIALPTVFLLALVAGSATLWLGPLVELFVFSDAAVNAIIAASPLSYLSAAAEYDYLRSEWFYRNTPFGSLRFAYPNSLLLGAIYLGFAAALQTLTLRLKPDPH